MTALTKFLQTEGVDYKMALVVAQGKAIMPTSYFGVSHGHIDGQKLESSAVSSQVDPWSRTDVGAKVVQYKPNENKVVLSNGREYTYKALVIAPGLDHRDDKIEGLQELQTLPEEENCYVHIFDDKYRPSRNYYHGWNHRNGDMLCYSPKAPYKGEGSDFWALYYESFLRQDQVQGLSSASARITYWTPNKWIYKFPYANEIALEECHKRGIDVNLGWELMKIQMNSVGEKVGTFKHVDSGAMRDHPFTHVNINPTSQPHQELVDSGIAGKNGMVDVCPYTLQHKRYNNIFAFGDCIDGETTRTQHAAHVQTPIVKYNLRAFLEGRELSAVYDGFTYMPFLMGHSHMTSFQHLWDYEPAPKNDWIPKYGSFPAFYWWWNMKGNMQETEKFASFKKTVGPPHYRFAASYDPLEKNDYLLSKDVDIAALKARNTGKALVEVHH